MDLRFSFWNLRYPYMVADDTRSWSSSLIIKYFRIHLNASSKVILLEFKTKQNQETQVGLSANLSSCLQEANGGKKKFCHLSY